MKNAGENESLLFKRVRFIDGFGQGFVADSEHIEEQGEFSEKLVYLVELENGDIRKAVQNELLQVGGYASKYTWGQNVLVLPDVSDAPDLESSTPVQCSVIGIAYDVDAREWYYTVLLSGAATIFPEAALKIADGLVNLSGYEPLL